MILIIGLMIGKMKIGRNKLMEEKCICCGAIVPKETDVCPNCLLCVKQVGDNEDNKISQPGI